MATAKRTKETTCARTRSPRRAAVVPTGVGDTVALSDFIDAKEWRGDLTVRVAGSDLTFTHLDRVYFPERAIRKADVLRYYARIADVILPFLRHRPAILS